MSEPTKTKRARDYQLANPSASIKSVARALGISTPLVVYARKQLIEEGLRLAGRESVLMRRRREAREASAPVAPVEGAEHEGEESPLESALLDAFPDLDPVTLAGVLIALDTMIQEIVTERLADSRLPTS